MRGVIANRESFLRNVSSALGRTHLREQPIRSWKNTPQFKVLENADEEELLDVFKKQCGQIHTKVVEAHDHNLADVIKQVFDDKGNGPIITWHDNRFEKWGLGTSLQDVVEDVYIWDCENPIENIQAAKNANIGVTICDLALAESATCLFLTNKDRGRSIHFLPLHSVILIPKSTIVKRMTQGVEWLNKRLENGEEMSSSVNFISGPSYSADIEMKLVVGVHGPVTMTYIILHDQ